MQRFILQRFGAFLITLVAVSIVIFLLCRLLPGNILNLMFFDDPNATPAAEHQEAIRLHLTGSYASQYLYWAGHLIRLNLGRSLATNQPVSVAVVQAIPITAELIVLGISFAIVFAIPLGIISAVMRDRLPDYAARLGGLIGISIPNFWLATLRCSSPRVCSAGFHRCATSSSPSTRSGTSSSSSCPQSRCRSSRLRS